MSRVPRWRAEKSLPVEPAWHPGVVPILSCADFFPWSGEIRKMRQGERELGLGPEAPSPLEQHFLGQEVGEVAEGGALYAWLFPACPNHPLLRATIHTGGWWWDRGRERFECGSRMAQGCGERLTPVCLSGVHSEEGRSTSLPPDPCALSASAWCHERPGGGSGDVPLELCLRC